MTTSQKPFALTLAVYPTTSDFAWVAFENPFLPYDWRVVKTRDRKNERALQIVEKLIRRLNPESLVLEAFESHLSKRSGRIARLCRAIVNLAYARGIEVAVYTRADIQACFAAVGARTRDEVAAAVARHVDAFSYRLPRKRRSWDREQRDMALFSAAALVLTHYHLSAARLLDDLRAAGC